MGQQKKLLKPKLRYIGKTMDEIYEDTKKHFNQYAICVAEQRLGITCSYVPNQNSPEGCAFRRLFQHSPLFKEYQGSGSSCFKEYLTVNSSTVMTFFSLLQSWHDSQSRSGKFAFNEAKANIENFLRTYGNKLIWEK